VNCNLTSRISGALQLIIVGGIIRIISVISLVASAEPSKYDGQCRGIATFYRPLLLSGSWCYFDMRMQLDVGQMVTQLM